MRPLTSLALLSAFLGGVYGDAIYTKNSPVLQVNAKNYNTLIAQSNHTSIVEFYAPWCGHCQNLKPAYEKAAKNLAGLAKVAAVNCDDDSNKPFCSQMGVQGFPTLKLVKPGSKPGKPVVEDYQGPRTAKAIVETMVEKIPNHITRLQDSGLENWLEEDPGTAKAILFTEKGTISALIRSLAIDFLGSVKFAQIRNKEVGAVEKFGITKFPSLLLLSSGSQTPNIYSDEMKRAPLLEFLSQAATPNPDPPLKKLKSSTSTEAVSASGKPAATKKAPPKPPIEIEDFQEIVLDDDTPLESPIPIVDSEKPVPTPEAIPAIPILSTPGELRQACLTPKSGNCLLVLLPVGSVPDAVLPESAATALAGLAQLADKHNKRHTKMFPFYGVPAENEAGKTIRGDLGLKSNAELEIIVTNMKRRWWRLYASDDIGVTALEAFIDGIRLSEGTKTPLPESFYPEPQASEPEAVEPVSQAAREPADAVDDNSSSATEPEPSAEPFASGSHDEL